jgi:ubiquinone/menaquinone biosynthesis C-methylase UbiE
METRYDVIVERVLRLVESHGIRTICDYGCGNGSLLERIRDSAPALSRIVGVDRFSTMCARHAPAKEGNRGIEFVDRDSNEFTLLSKSGAFDLVLSIFSLHHFHYPLAELATIKSMLSPTGHIFACEHDYEGETDGHRVKNFVFFIDEYLKAEQNDYHRHHYTMKQALDLFSTLGAQSIECERYSCEESEEEKTKRVNEHLGRNEMKPALLAGMDPVRASIFKELFDMERSLLLQYGLDMRQFLLFSIQLG